MKTVTAVLSLLMLSSMASAQSPDPSKWMCRNLADSGGFTYQGETIFGTQACRPIPQGAPAVPTAVPAPKQDAKIVPTSNPVVSAAAPATPQPAAAVISPVASESIPAEPGMYVAAAGGYTKILGQILDFKRTGSLLASDVTFHLKSSKENVQLLGAHAQTVTTTTPEFYYTPAKQEADAGVNAGDFILVHLEEKKERRQVEIGAQGVGRASKGIALTHQVQLSRSEVKPGVYRIAPAVGLSAGEYGLYLSRGEGMAAYIYDFSVQ
ncbi:MAG: hypothetical protein WBX16_22180 [Candidatus Acidiferrales bacterium]